MYVYLINNIFFYDFIGTDKIKESKECKEMKMLYDLKILIRDQQQIIELVVSE